MSLGMVVSFPQRRMLLKSARQHRYDRCGENRDDGDRIHGAIILQRLVLIIMPDRRGCADSVADGSDGHSGIDFLARGIEVGDQRSVLVVAAWITRESGMTNFRKLWCFCPI
jgi:hypothetical protein